MAWLEDNGDETEFSRLEEEPSGDKDLGEDEEAQEEEVVVIERPSPAGAAPAAKAKSKARASVKAKAPGRTCKEEAGKEGSG